MDTTDALYVNLVSSIAEAARRQGLDVARVLGAWTLQNAGRAPDGRTLGDILGRGERTGRRLLADVAAACRALPDGRPMTAGPDPATVATRPPTGHEAIVWPSVWEGSGVGTDGHSSPSPVVLSCGDGAGSAGAVAGEPADSDVGAAPSEGIAVVVRLAEALRLEEHHRKALVGYVNRAWKRHKHRESPIANVAGWHYSVARVYVLDRGLATQRILAHVHPKVAKVGTGGYRDPVRRPVARTGPTDVTGRRRCGKCGADATVTQLSTGRAVVTCTAFGCDWRHVEGARPAI